jgi:hypothetical protein
MKFFYLLAFCLVMQCISAFAQNTDQYRWSYNPPVFKECDFTGKIIKDKFVAPPPYTYFTIVSRKNEDTVIVMAGLAAKVKSDGSLLINEPEKFRQLNIASAEIGQFGNNKLNTAEVNMEAVESKRKYFLVPTALLGSATALPVYAKGWGTRTLTIGAATLPFKLRLHDFDFAKDLNIGSVIGWNIRTHRIKNNFLNLMANISVSVNDIDKYTARNVPDEDLPAKNIAALTLAGGLVYQSGKGQVGLFYGFDFMSHTNWTRYRWVYNKRPWIGLGFGINLFQKEDLSMGPADELDNYNRKKKKKPAQAAQNTQNRPRKNDQL